MKRFKYFVQTFTIISCIMVMGWCVTSCGSDDDDNNGNAPKGVEAVDLGLPSGTKWASCNLGATKPEEYGGYYAWGEIEEKDSYNWETYIHCDGSWSTCHDLGSDIRGTAYDVAHVKWGGDWVMPTYEQMKELIDNCKYRWMNNNGVYGVVFVGPNGNRIFLPAAKYRADNPETIISGGRYWSSTYY